MALTTSDFASLPVDLHGAAIAYGEWLANRGFVIDVEPFDLDFPNTPVFASRSSQANHFFEVSSSPDLTRAEDWLKYGRASSEETRYTVAVTDSNIESRALARLKSMGIGVDLIEGITVVTIAPPHDLAINMGFPSLKGPQVRAFRSSRDLLDQGHWQESFEDACVTLEMEARSHLARGIATGKYTFVSAKGTSVSYDADAVGKMTLGQLGKVYGEVANPAMLETRLTQSITRVNANRVTVAHYKGQSGKRGETLRATVGRDLNVIVNAHRMLMP